MVRTHRCPLNMHITLHCIDFALRFTVLFTQNSLFFTALCASVMSGPSQQAVCFVTRELYVVVLTPVIFGANDFPLLKTNGAAVKSPTLSHTYQSRVVG